MQGVLPGDNGTNGRGHENRANEFYQSSFVSTAPYNNTVQTQPGRPYMPPPTSSQPPHPHASGVDMSADYENEPPLLEELGINIGAVVNKARTVANPFSKIDSSFADDADMTGPVVLGILLGFAHMFQKKVQFSVIYSQMIVGCLSVYFIFNLMSTRGIDLYRSTSVLGYSLLPIVILSFLAPIKYMGSLRFLLAPVATACIIWSSSTATKIFVAVLQLQHQFWLIFYPIALLYTSFVIITIF